MTHLEQMNEHIAQMQSWLFDGDMADDDPDMAQHYANAERARKSAQLYALAAVAESLARIADVMETGPAETTESRAMFRAMRDSY